jgi:hypothetical protein
MNKCVRTRSPWKGIVINDNDVHVVIQCDLERATQSKFGSPWNIYTRKLLGKYEIFPKDHPLRKMYNKDQQIPRGGLSSSVHKQRWFRSPFDFHSNSEIDQIVEISWREHEKVVNNPYVKRVCIKVGPCQDARPLKKKKLLIDCSFSI